MKFITKYQSPNFNHRIKNSEIKFVIIHYTAMISLKESLRHLCDSSSKVSSHFLISKNGDIYKLVNEEKRAWHAGKSCWKNVSDINSNSLGIELQNSGHYLKFEKYKDTQIKSLIKLLKYIKLSYNISKKNILGHSDIAPMRKSDPGEKFPWAKLKKNNLVYLPNKIKINKNQKINPINIIDFKKKLKRIGYYIRINSKNDEMSKNITRAFQMHYQQKFITGYPNQETLLLLDQICKDIKDIVD